MKINEVCTKTQCVVQMGPKRGFGAGDVDPKLANAAGKVQDAKDDKMMKQAEIEDEKFYRMKDHGERQNKPKTLMQAVGEASFDLPSSDFRHTEKFTVGTGKELEFAKYISRQLETMGVTKEQATRLYKASKDGDYSWVERFGKSPKLKQLIGHNIGTAMTTNAVAIHNGMGLLAGLLKIQPKQTKIPTPSQVPDDLQPGGHDTDEYLRSKDNKQARQYYDRDMNWSGLR